MIDSTSSLARLRQRIAALSGGAGPGRSGAVGPCFTLGVAAVDVRLGGGLAHGALHEVQGRHAASQAGFALMLAARAMQEGARPLLWITSDARTRMDGALYGPGLVELGIDPARLFLIQSPDELGALRAAADSLAYMGVGAVILEAGKAKQLDLTASRRLQLAAAQTGIACFVLRDVESRLASAASTRWQVDPRASASLPGDAPGHSTLKVELLRHRGGIPPFEIELEWDRDDRKFRQAERHAPHHRALLPAAERGQMAA